MVGKLMKHELRALFRVLLYVGIVDLALSVIGRILIGADPDGVLGFTLCILAVYVAFVMIFAAFVTSVGQFSRSLFTGEGYMTFSLPVTPVQLIVAKLLSAILLSFFGVAVAVLSTVIIVSGIDEAVLNEITQYFSVFWEQIEVYFSSDPMLIVELVVVIIVSVPMTLLTVFAVESVGQLFTKARVAVTFAIAIGVIVVVEPLLSQYCLTPILAAAESVSIHLANWIEIFVYAGIDVGCFFLIRYILTHKVNLIV